MALRRQLDQEEARIYASGMAAHRRGENKPKEHLPYDMYKVWLEGWKRVGRHVFESNLRSKNHSTLSQGLHMERTEVETLDDALKVIARQQRNTKQSAATKGKQTLKQQFGAAAGQQVLRRRNARRKTELAVTQDKISDFEERQVARINKAIELLCFSVEECSALSAMHRFYPAISQSALIGMVEKLCNMIQRPMPSFGVSRGAIRQIPRTYCISCGTELERRSTEKYCLHCKPPDESIKIASDMRRERERNLVGLQNETRKLGRLINDLEVAINHDDGEGHG